MQIRTKEYGKVLVFLFRGALDIRAKDKSETFILEQLNREIEVICIDCSELTYIDSSGLGIFINLSKMARERNYELVLCEIDSKISSVFDISKLDQFFKIMSWRDFSENYI
ncbi:MAG: STAS domain-containing protein [Spirochaetes bacterium]|jgi:anti-sigma B factor antagonist|nr:STAS domain-containing protein [Spirochaetota bacterium]